MIAPPDRPQDDVAGVVAVAVVEPLEVIDVDHQDPDGVLRSAAAGEQPAELVEVAPVREAGQGVGGGSRLGRAMRVDPGQRRRRLEGGAAEEPARGGGPGVGDPPRDDDGADDPVAPR